MRRIPLVLLVTGHWLPAFARKLRRGRLVTLLAILVTGHWSLVTSATAQAPSLINYQGRLLNGTNLYNGAANIAFRFCTNSAGGTHHFESTNLATVVDGLYSTAIGEYVTLGQLDEALDRPAVWLEVIVNGVALAPRERILAAGYARRAHGLQVTSNGTVVLNTVAGTNRADATAKHSSIAGGAGNTITNAWQSSIGGGRDNTIQDFADNAVIDGGARNLIQNDALYTAIGGGFDNAIRTSALASAIGGGRENEIESGSTNAIIGGGRSNTIGRAAHASVIAGGQENTIRTGAQYAAIGGGQGNTLETNTDYSVIAGGQQNAIQRDAQWGAVGGGVLNVIGSNAIYAAIPGGYDNRIAANAYNAFAAGRQARANHQGVFVWADNTVADFASTTDNQFSVRATGGVRWSDDTPGMSFGTTTRQMINLWSTNYGIGIQNFAQYFRTDGDFYWYKGGQHNNATGNSGGGSNLMSLTTAGLTVNGTFVSASDRQAKTDIKPADPAAVLDGIARLPIATWRYRHDTNSLHIGPMAQDFRAAFGLGPDERHITMVDADGVSLASIQALYKIVQEQQKRIEELERALRREDQVTGDR